MKSDSPAGREILLTHENLKATLIETYRNNPRKLAQEIEKLTFICLRRFRALHLWPDWDFGEDYE